ncbi:hypothetical protein B9Z55_020914 [Caenorhabditis nigoni]|uniref:F-box domain-containing protein n=1 Tax=Caenorhabditis nigoni TaxID=1611254 RepID=A0A2G5TQ94_9PELO|nr:hypothetical protein B9Z55_020914 [Caenorhabditis nigoni]
MYVLDFSTPTWLILFYNTISVFSIVLNTLGIYLLLFQCQKLGSFRYWFLAYQTSCLLTDLHITILLQPVPLFPLISGYLVGVSFTWFGVMPIYSIVTAGDFIIIQFLMLMMLFFKKHRAIARIAEGFITPRSIDFSLLSIFILMAIVVDYELLSNQLSESNRWDFIQQSVPEYMNDFKSLPNFVIFAAETVQMKYLVTGVSLTAPMTTILVAVLAIDIFRMMNLLKLKVSSATNRKHSEAVKCLTVQVATSVLSLAPAVLMAVFLAMKSTYSQTMSKVSIVWFSTHSSLNMVCLLLFFPPFKSFLKKKYQTPPTLDSLPNELIDKISQKLGPIDKLCLRNASKRIQEVVDRKIIQFTYLRLVIKEHFVEISLNYDNPVLYFRYQHNRCLVFNQPRPRKVLIGNWLLIALNVWKAIISIKSLRVRLVVYDISKEKVDISRIMRRIQPGSVFADHIYIHAENYRQVPVLLAQFKTELIETMKLSVYNKTGDKPFNGIFQMEKFKNVEEVNMLEFGLIRAADLKWLIGFPMFFVNLVSIPVNDLIWLKNRTQVAFGKFAEEAKRFDLTEDDILETLEVFKTNELKTPSEHDVLTHAIGRKMCAGITFPPFRVKYHPKPNIPQPPEVEAEIRILKAIRLRSRSKVLKHEASQTEKEYLNEGLSKETQTVESSDDNTDYQNSIDKKEMKVDSDVKIGGKSQETACRTEKENLKEKESKQTQTDDNGTALRNSIITKELVVDSDEPTRAMRKMSIQTEKVGRQEGRDKEKTGRKSNTEAKHKVKDIASNSQNIKDIRSQEKKSRKSTQAKVPWRY